MIKYVIATKDRKEETPSTIYLDNSYGNSIFKKYNTGVSTTLENNRTCDIICFMHDDVTILDANFEKKAQMVFDRFPNIGILGVIGTKVFNALGGWWTCDRRSETMGHIMQGHPDGSVEHMIDCVGFSKDMITVDGCCFFIRSSLFMDSKIRFDDRVFNGYHFYDADICIQAKIAGYDVAVADILIQHASEGPLSKDWQDSRIKFINKWVDRGYNFPLTLASFKDRK